jgi:ATP synthase protein I
MDGYLRLQRRLVFATLLVIAMAVPLTAWRFGPTNALSLLMGGVAGMLYLRMLARNVARFGVASKTLGKASCSSPCCWCWWSRGFHPCKYFQPWLVFSSTSPRS